MVLRKLILILSFTLVFDAVSAGFTYNNIKYNINSDSISVTVTGSSVYNVGVLDIPPTVTYKDITYTVTEIGDEAFKTASITKVIIPNTVKRIGVKAFYGAAGLQKVEEVTFGNSVEIIDEQAFYWTVIKQLNLPNSLKIIGKGAFMRCKDFTELEIPSSVKIIGTDAFYACTKMRSVTVPATVDSVGGTAFAQCGLQNVTWNVKTKHCGIGIFYCCQITKLTIGSEVEEIPPYFLNNNYGKMNSFEIPASVTTIGKYAFYNCKMKDVNIPSTVTSIGDSAFCSTSMQSLSLPKSVKSFGKDVFFKCHGLENIVVESGTPIYDSRDNCNALIETSSNTLLVGSASTVIPSTVTAIADYAFEGCTNLATLDVPNSITSIGKYAFNGCTGLTSVTLGNSLSAISEFLFQGCTSLTSIIIPNSVTDIANSAFSGCTSLSAATIPTSVKSIGNYAFSDCTSLWDIYSYPKPDSLTLGVKVFNNVATNHATIHVLPSYLKEYCLAEQWREFSNIVDDLEDSGSGSGEEDLKGDINNDGSVDITDVVKLANIVMGM